MPDTIYFPPNCDCVGLFERFYFKWNRPFFSCVLKDVPNFDYDLAREICQQVWLEIWQAVTTGTYTYLRPGLLVYRANARITDHCRRTARFAQLDLDSHDTADRSNMDERIDYKTALATLPDDEHSVFTLYFREGLTQDEIGVHLEISTRTVRRKLDAALVHLREFV
jgi:RNA polymerase sigma factor (sigma-70 family)